MIFRNNVRYDEEITRKVQIQTSFVESIGQEDGNLIRRKKQVISMRIEANTISLIEYTIRDITFNSYAQPVSITTIRLFCLVVAKERMRELNYFPLKNFTTAKETHLKPSYKNLVTRHDYVAISKIKFTIYQLNVLKSIRFGAPSELT